MKRIAFILFASLMLLLFACSEKDDNPTDVNVYGYNLAQFIDKAIVATSVDAAADTTELRQLFNYEIVSGDEDAWSPRMSVNAGYDLNWETFRLGYLVPTDNNRVWFQDPMIPSAFKVRNTATFRLYRKIIVHSGNGSKEVELRGLDVQQISNWDGNPEDAIKLSDLLQGIADYDSVSIVCYDDYGVDKYDQSAAIEDGYYLLDSERTIFPTATLPNNQKKMKKVAYLQVYGGSAQEHSFELAPITTADHTFQKPASLSGFTSTILPVGD